MTFWTLSYALIWRISREQRYRLLLFPFGFALLMTAVCVTAIAAPQALTGTTQAALTASARVHFPEIVAEHSSAALLLAFLFVQGPYFVGIFSAMFASSMTSSLIAQEADRGSLESILTLPYSRADILRAILGAVALISTLLWLVFGGVFVILSGIMVGIVAPDLNIEASLFTKVLLVPLPVTLLAALLTLTIAVLAPRLTTIQTGNAGNVAQLLSILPAIGVFALINLAPPSNVAATSAAVLAVGVLGCLVATLLLGISFKAERFLAST